MRGARMDMARVEKLKNEKIFTLSRKMADEQFGTCSAACSPDGAASNTTTSNSRYCVVQSCRGSDILLDRQEDI